MKLYTIGFTKKSASAFFGLLHAHRIRLIIDIRLHPDSQLSGFARKSDLPYFLSALVKAKYMHMVSLAPSEELFQSYRKGGITLELYRKELMQCIKERTGLQECFSLVEKENRVCLLCSEASSNECHRSWIAEALVDMDTSRSLTIDHL
jgi:uncharacterized protein (DUF488 family)